MKAKTNLYLQGRHSRNTNDWSVRVEGSGRYAFESDGMGVLLRIGILTDYLEGNPKGVEAMGEYLNEIDSSYNKNDVGQPIKQMIKLKMVTTSGKGRGTVYTLTSNAKSILKNVNKVIV